jgi:tetratricopeptide (TPR) repeat protein
VLSEGGVLGSGALLFLVGMALRVWWRGWRNAESLLAVAPARPEVYPGGRLLLLACGAAGMGIAVHGLVEVPIINVITMYIALLAVALAPGGGWQLREYPAAPQTTTATSPVGRLWRGILRVHPLHSVLMVAAVLAWGGGISIFWQRSINDALQNQARAALQQGDAARAVNLYDQSIAAYPWEPAAYYERATALAWLAREQPARLPEALEAQATAVTHAPSHGIVAPVNQGALLLAMGAEAQATEVLRAAIETTTPRWAVPRMLLAQIAEHTGDDDTARTRWRQALEREPELADSAACLHSAICGSVPLPETEQAALVAARALSQEADPAALRQIEQLASAWRSVDIWAVGVLAAERANDPQARARFLAAAQAEAENVARDVTPLLAAVLLRDARARGNTEAVRTLANTWVAARDMRLVPQLTRHLITPTDLALAQELVAAARFLDDPTLLAKAQHRMAFFEDALTRPLP